MADLPAIRTVLGAYRSTGAHITEAQIQAAWAEYESVREVSSGVSEQQIEAGARALYEYEAEGYVDSIGWDGRPKHFKDAYRRKAEAVLRAALSETRDGE